MVHTLFHSLICSPVRWHAALGLLFALALVSTAAVQFGFKLPNFGGGDKGKGADIGSLLGNMGKALKERAKEFAR